MSIQSAVNSMWSSAAYASGEWRRIKAQEQIARNTEQRENTKLQLRAERNAIQAVNAQTKKDAEDRRKENQQLQKNLDAMKAEIAGMRAQWEIERGQNSQMSSAMRDIIGHKDWDAAVELTNEQMKRGKQ